MATYLRKMHQCLLLIDQPICERVKMYLDYLKTKSRWVTEEITLGQIKKMELFKNNLLQGIEYYENLSATTPFFSKAVKKEISVNLIAIKGVKRD
jgi:hypothetical protein